MDLEPFFKSIYSFSINVTLVLTTGFFKILPPESPSKKESAFSPYFELLIVTLSPLNSPVLLKLTES